PLSTALPPVSEVAARVVTPGGGSATRIRVAPAVLELSGLSSFSLAVSGLVLTSTGTALLSPLLLPRLPKVASPQITRVPSEHMPRGAQLFAPPRAVPPTVLPYRAETPLAVFTATGVLNWPVLLFPSWPKELTPQATTPPSAHNARV